MEQNFYSATSPCKVLLTADITIMSNNQSLFYGFLSAAPRKGIPFVSAPLLFKIMFKNVPCDSGKRAELAPMGLRRIESSLIHQGFSREDVVITTSNNLRHFFSESLKVIGISVMDPLGKGPASSSFGGKYGIINHQPFNSFKFEKFMESNTLKQAKLMGVKIVVGGPGAWQLDDEEMTRLGIDVVVDGEADLLFPEVVKKIIDGRLETPSIIKAKPSDIPETSQIPPALGATIGGIVEISRGCGRGCNFCLPNLRRVRHRPQPDIIADVRTNVENGQSAICLHAEDVLRYGTSSIIPESEKVINLFQSVNNISGITDICISHASLASIASSPQTLGKISDLLGYNEHRWMGFQTGIETGSPAIIERLMSMKAAPFKPSEWHHVVETAFAICHDNNWVPAATLVVNLPGETEQDVTQTIELVESLREFKSIIVPLLFVPMGESIQPPMRMIDDAKSYHCDLYKSIWRHDMRWMQLILDDYTRGNGILTKIALKGAADLVKNVADPIAVYLLNKRAKAAYKEMELRRRKIEQKSSPEVSNAFEPDLYSKS